MGHIEAADLPEDILHHIFDLSADDSITVDGKEWGRSGLPTQVVLSHVSSHWREIALSMPKLWRVIKISSFYYYTVPITQEILSRVGPGRPISLHLSFSEAPTVAYVAHELIHPFQFKELSIDMYVWQLSLLNASLLGAGATLKVEILKLAFMKRHYLTVLSHAPPPTLGQTKWPHLKHVAVTFCTSPIKLDYFNLPWDQLLKIDLCSPLEPSQCLRAIKPSVPVLESLTIALDVDSQDHPFMTEDLEFSRLQSLTTIIVDGPTIIDFLKKVRLPALRRLVVKGTGPVEFALEISSVLECLRSSPLEEIILDKYIGMDEQTITGLASGRFGPRVQSLTVEGKWDLDAILGLIEARLEKSLVARGIVDGGVLPFKLVTFKFDVNEMDGKYSNRKERIEKRGVKIINCLV